MASSKEVLSYILDQLSSVPGITHRGMMGEYLLYLHGKLAGGIYDDRLMVKPVPAARALLPEAPEELPYPGSKSPLLRVDCVDDRKRLSALFLAMEPELPAPKPRKKRSKCPISSS